MDIDLSDPGYQLEIIRDESENVAGSYVIMNDVLPRFWIVLPRILEEPRDLRDGKGYHPVQRHKVLLFHHPGSMDDSVPHEYSIDLLDLVW